MDAIVLEPSLRMTLEQDAAHEANSVNDLINEADDDYLRERQQAKIDREIVAYEEMHAELLRDNLDEWVALHNQELVEHDRDRVALDRRLRAWYGRTSVLIRQVLLDPIEEIWMRTPSTGRTTAMRFAYNTDYIPQAPHLEIRMAVPDETFRMAPLAVLVDTGADDDDRSASLH